MNLFPKLLRTLKRLIRHLVFRLWVVPALLLVIIIRLAKPFILIRFLELHNLKLGHFALNTELYFAERKNKINRPVGSYIDIAYYGHEMTCNQYLGKLWSREILIIPRDLAVNILRFYNFFFQLQEHIVGANTQHDRDVWNLLDDTDPQIKFSAKEIERGAKALILLGVPQGAEFVCITVRDSCYMTDFLRADTSPDNYRDANIDNYYQAIQGLLDNGFYVIRMGVKVHKRMTLLHPRLIDYPYSKYRSEFMDIYLGAHCKFAISTATGWDAIPYMFRRPVCYTNAVPMAYLFTFSGTSLLLSKHFSSRQNGAIYTLRQIFEKGLFCLTTTQDYDVSETVLIENSSQEIYDIVLEMMLRSQGLWNESEADRNLQKKFKNIYQSSKILDAAGKNLHGEFRAKYGAIFLRKNKDWLENGDL